MKNYNCFRNIISGVMIVVIVNSVPYAAELNFKDYPIYSSNSEKSILEKLAPDSDKAYFFDNKNPTKLSLPIDWSHRGKDDSECSRSMFTQNSQITYKSTIKPTNEIVKIYDENPDVVITAIKSLMVKDTFIELEVYAKSIHKEYESNVFETYENKHYAARPGTALTVQVLTLGLAGIFAPKMSALQLIGCDDIRITERSPDSKNRRVTGLYLANPGENIFSLEISGLGTESIKYSRTVDTKKESLLRIDMTDAIKRSAKEVSTNLVVRCSSCSVLSDSDKTITSLIGHVANIEAKFFEIKQKFDDEENLVIEKARVESLRIVAQKADIDRRAKIETERISQEKKEMLDKIMEQEKKDKLKKIEQEKKQRLFKI